jgi:hypothetical protein
MNVILALICFVPFTRTENVSQFPTPTLSLSHSVPVGINSTIVIRPSSSVRFNFKSKINYWKQFWSEMSIILGSVDTDTQVVKTDIYDVKNTFDANSNGRGI